MLTLTPGLIRGNNFLCDFRREAIMDKMYERFDVLYREAPHTFLTSLDHIGDIGEFAIRKPSNPLDKIVTVF
jgi:hypothetical protein